MIKFFQFPPLWHLPNVSIFCMKLETYLRMTKIPFKPVSVIDPRKAPMGKLPFIEDNGKQISDSSFIIEYLKKKYGDPLDMNLSQFQVAQGLALQRLLEEHLYWVLIYCRWSDPAYWPITKKEFFGHLPALPKLILPTIINKQMKKTLWAQGVGRHSRDHIYEMGVKDLTALATILGDQAFIMGDQPTSLDACVYACVANILVPPIESPLKAFVSSQTNLVSYAARMKEKFYS